MPNQRAKGVTPRTVAVPDDLWGKLQAIAAQRGVKVSVIVRDALERYVRTSHRTRRGSSTPTPTPRS